MEAYDVIGNAERYAAKLIQISAAVRSILLFSSPSMKKWLYVLFNWKVLSTSNWEIFYRRDLWIHNLIIFGILWMLLRSDLFMEALKALKYLHAMVPGFQFIWIVHLKSTGAEIFGYRSTTWFQVFKYRLRQYWVCNKAPNKEHGFVDFKK